jgi:hypothetical protein
MHSWADLASGLLAITLVMLTPLIAYFVGAVVHEAGHAILGRLAGFEIGSVGLGVARPLWIGRWGETRTFVARSRPTTGITFVVSPSLHPSRWQWIAFLGGGILAQSAFGIVALWVSTFLPGRVFWLIAGVLNLFVAITQLLPIVVHAGTFTLRTDGALLLRVLVRGAPGATFREKVLVQEGLRELWREVGDTLTPRVSLLAIVLGWLELPALEPARRAWDELAALPGDPPRWLRLLREIVGASLAHASEDRDGATAILDRVDEDLARDPHPGLSLVTASVRAQLLAEAGDSAELTRLIEEHPTVRRQPALRVALLAARARILADQPGADLGALEHEYWRTSAYQRSDGSERALFHALARASVACGDIERARPAYRVALAAAARMVRGWTHAPSRTAFVDANAALLADARAFFASHGPPADLLAVDGFGTEAPSVAVTRPWQWAVMLLIAWATFALVLAVNALYR